MRASDSWKYITIRRFCMKFWTDDSSVMISENFYMARLECLAIIPEFWLVKFSNRSGTARFWHYDESRTPVA